MDLSFAAFALKAEEELARVMDTELRTRGLRSRAPELKWRPPLQENDDGKEVGGDPGTRVWMLMETRLQETVNILEGVLQGEREGPICYTAGPPHTPKRGVWGVSG